MTKQIYITRKIPETGLKLLRDKGINFEMGTSKIPPTKKELIKVLSKKPYDGVISFLTDTLDKEVFDACPTSHIFANFAVGFNNVDTEEAKKRGIQISNTPGTSATAVAEHTVAFMLTLTTRIDEGDRFMRKGIGLIGAGQIGTEVAKILHYGFGSNVIYSDISPNIELEKIIGENKRKETFEILREADIVSLHVPLLPSTKHLINKETLSMMKKTSFLINTSRGGVIDEKELVYALKNGVIKGAALDVYEFEPKLTKGLNKLCNIVLTPHIASARQSARDMMAEISAKNIISFFETGEAINNVIK